MSDTLGIDATHSIDAKAIAKSGYKFVGRYCLDGPYRIDKEEANRYLANSLDVLLFGEHEAEMMLGGAPRGKECGEDAHDYLLNTLQAPTGTVVFFTVDFDAQPNQFPKIGAFLSAADIELRPQYRAGIYGGYNVIEAFGGWPSFQTEAWSVGRISDHANFYQRVGTTLPPIAGTQPGEYDEDIAINPVGLWSPDPAPVTEDDEMPFVIAYLTQLDGYQQCKLTNGQKTITDFGVSVSGDFYNLPAAYWNWLNANESRKQVKRLSLTLEEYRIV